VVTTADIDYGPDSKTGLGDVSGVYVFAFDQDWGTFGLGAAGAVPLASDPLLGARKWTIGPAVDFADAVVKCIGNEQVAGSIDGDPSWRSPPSPAACLRADATRLLTDASTPPEGSSVPDSGSTLAESHSPAR
jgi:hypothetical protein